MSETIDIVVAETGAAEAADAIASVGDAADPADGKVASLGAESATVGDKLTEAGNKGAEGTGKISSGTKEAAVQMDLLGAATGKLSSLLEILGIAFGVKYILDASQAYLGMENSLRQVTNSAGELEAVQHRLHDLSNATYTDEVQNAESYMKLAQSLRATTATGSDALTMLKSIDSFVSAAGHGAEEAAQMVQTLSYGFSQNTFAGRPMMMMIDRKSN